MTPTGKKEKASFTTYVIPSTAKNQTTKHIRKNFMNDLKETADKGEGLQGVAV